MQFQMEQNSNFPSLPHEVKYFRNHRSNNRNLLDPRLSGVLNTTFYWWRCGSVSQTQLHVRAPSLSHCSAFQLIRLIVDNFQDDSSQLCNLEGLSFDGRRRSLLGDMTLLRIEDRCRCKHWVLGCPWILVRSSWYAESASSVINRSFQVAFISLLS